MVHHIIRIASELQCLVKQVEATVSLLDEGSTVPFIARYRKEATEGLDEVQIATIRDRMEQLRELDKRREVILSSIEEQGKLTDDLKKKIEAAETMSVLEDLYLPFKPKRKTRASMAREKGLEPLANQLFELSSGNPYEWAKQFINEELGVKSVEEALAGARDILAEQINEDAENRSEIRELYEREAIVSSKVIPGKEVEGEKYKDYFDFSGDLRSMPSHRTLALRRAEKEMIISLDIEPEEEAAIYRMERRYIKKDVPSSEQLRLAIKDSYKRLLKPSMETEIRMSSKFRADEEAIQVFAENMRQLLLASPLGQKRVLGLDPGFRTGCKVVCLDSQGQLIDNTAIYPNEPQKEITKSAAVIAALCQKHKIEAIAIGNGTASRETERFIRSIGLPSSILILMVNESGASIYSASAVAREEFPDYDLTVRGAVSIARRLMDPLAELVKIDPKSIGVGQYQHDVDQKALKKSLDDVVVSCVNAVGVEVNTASKELLSYVSGLGPSLAQNIVNFRNENGPFKSRKQLMKVPRLGEKAFEQAAGFLRIRNGAHPLDASAVHPERYELVEKMAKDVGCSLIDLMQNAEWREKIDIKKYVSKEVGLPTLEDILSELSKPGRDPRKEFEAFQYTEGVESISDLKVGQKLKGTVTNITDFGAFVDIGVHQDGLVHLSQMSDKFIKHPTEAVHVQQSVEVTVMEVDVHRKRISLSMKSDPFAQKTVSKGGERKAVSIQRSAPKKEEISDFAAQLSKLKDKFK